MKPPRLVEAVLASLLVLAPVSRGEERPAPRAPDLLSLVGFAAGPAATGRSAVAGLALATAVAAEGRWGVAVEVWPVLAWRVQENGGRRVVPAAAAAGLLTFDAGRREASWRLRLEAGAGPMYALDPVPAAGSRWNFFAEAGLRLARPGRRLSLGYRFVHVSNGTGPGPDNPGLNLHSVLLGWKLR